jgi:hypothetical protein
VRRISSLSIVLALALADFVILSDNPVTIDPQDINRIQVLETIKEGKSVWVRSGQT